MRLAQDDKMVHTLAPDQADEPFGKAILPRRGFIDNIGQNQAKSSSEVTGPTLKSRARSSSIAASATQLSSLSSSNCSA